MFETILKVVDWLKGQSLPIRFLVIILISALIAVFTFTSCSRSTMKFRGTGEVEYYFKGSNGPDLSNSNSN